MKSLLIAKGQTERCLLTQMTNRHGLIAGATGTGKTVTLQTMAEQLSACGVPVFMADIKGDLSGLSQTGGSVRAAERAQKLGLTGFSPRAFPVTFWDVFGEQGHPVRTTISEMGPLLLAKLLDLNEVQAGVLNVVFEVADDAGMLLLDLKDLRAMLQFVADNAAQFSAKYGNVSKASVGAVQRGLLALESQGGDKLFGEPAFNIFDLMQTREEGFGVINILAADKLMNAPKTYATFLLWMLSELFEKLPEVGDLDKPRLVFFFDEAHLLFHDVPEVLLDKIEQVVRLIRSKGVGVFFVTQNPLDIPDKVAAQLGNRVQHALRAFTPKDQKSVRAAAQTFRANPAMDVEKAITELEVGEALVSFLDEKGAPVIVERALIVPPQSRIGTATADERQRLIKQSFFYGRYEQMIDRESAYEKLRERAETAEAPASSSRAVREDRGNGAQKLAPSKTESRPVGRPRDSLMDAMAKSAVRSVGSSIARQLVRGVLGSLFGGKR